MRAAGVGSYGCRRGCYRFSRVQRVVVGCGEVHTEVDAAHMSIVVGTSQRRAPPLIPPPPRPPRRAVRSAKPRGVVVVCAAPRCAQAGAVPGWCRGGAGVVPGRCWGGAGGRCRGGAGAVPGQCRGGAGAVPLRCRCGGGLKGRRRCSGGQGHIGWAWVWGARRTPRHLATGGEVGRHPEHRGHHAVGRRTHELPRGAGGCLARRLALDALERRAVGKARLDAVQRRGDVQVELRDLRLHRGATDLGAEADVGAGTRLIGQSIVEDAAREGRCPEGARESRRTRGAETGRTGTWTGTETGLTGCLRTRSALACQGQGLGSRARVKG